MMGLMFDIGKEAMEPAVAGLDLSAPGWGDHMDLAFQRSEALSDLPKSGRVGLNPTHIAVTRCGYAVFDRFAAQDFKATSVLTDREDNGLRHLRQARAMEQSEKIARFGTLMDLPTLPKARRALLRKGAA